MRKMSELPYHIGLKLKIYPSNEQKRLIAVNDGVKRVVYNHLVACGNEKYRLSKAVSMVPSYRSRLEYVSSVSGTAANIKNALPFLYRKEVDEQAIANVIQNYRNAWKNMKELHKGVPVFKKKGSEQSYQTNAHYYKDKNGNLTSNVRFADSHHITLPKLGLIRCDGSKKRIGDLLSRTADTRIGTITISKDAVGEYWVSLSIGSEAPFHKPMPKTGRQHGIDLNLLELINGSDGYSAPNMHFYRDSQKKLTKAQRKLSRMGEHAKQSGKELISCKRYQKQRRKVAKLHRQIQRQRMDYLHVLSKREVENQDFIAAEDLKVRNMVKNHKLAKSISDAGWRTFLTMLNYKGECYGKTVVLVPPRNTTQTCSVCGYVLKGSKTLTLADRDWTCPNCHTYHDRDTNAGKVILQRALELYTA